MKRVYFAVLLVVIIFSALLNEGCTGKKVPSGEDMSAYLLVYFQDPTHSLHMGLSEDGYTFTAINDGNPVVAGDTIAGQKGIRDPHITRGPDGAFYVAMTDLHIFGKQEGLRDTQWERPAEKYDWGNNRGFVLMKSYDLIHWTHHKVYIQDAYPDLDVGCAWAPQTIYDPVEDKMMLYFTMRIGHGLTRMYYAYTDDDFTKLVSEPELLFNYPKEEIQVLDADITPLPDGRYCMMYVAQENPGGIRVAFSDSINSGYKYEDRWVDFERGSCEAPNMWKRIGEEKWVLMYDVFSVHPHNFGFAETTDFKTFENLGRFNEGVMKTTNFSSPKHGAVIHLTQKEAETLKDYWENQRDDVVVEKDFQNLKITGGYANNLKWDLPLDTVGKHGSNITWKSGNTDYITNSGELLKRSPRNGDKIEVTMTAEISCGEASEEKTFDISIAKKEPEYDGYLFAYFEGNADSRKSEEQLRFAVSGNAVDWSALNGNKPILDSDEISQSGGIRDPHILRGEDNRSFYMVATDMSTATNGWRSNPGIVMLRSDDLLNWQHSTVNLSEQYPEKFGNAYWIWAPQTVYDPAAGKYLVYFTVRFENDDKLDFYSAYANGDFSGFESEPTMMFRAKHGAIDGDIVYKDGIWHLFFKGNTKNEEGEEFKNGIKQATARTLQGPWKEYFNYLDAYHDKRTTVEGSSVFKLNNSDTYILMYDLYSSGRYEFQRSTDLYNFTQNPESFTKNFHPRHGSVISLKAEEARRLDKKWGGVPDELKN